MQRLTESPLETQVEELAALLFTISDIALFTGLDEEEFRADLMDESDSVIAKAYHRGKLRTKIMLRFDSLNYAIHGSPQALNEMKEHLADQLIDENA